MGVVEELWKQKYYEKTGELVAAEAENTKLRESRLALRQGLAETVDEIERKYSFVGITANEALAADDKRFEGE